MKDAFAEWLAWRLPKRVVYWAAIRLMGYASSVYSDKEVNALTPADCLKAWSEQ